MSSWPAIPIFTCVACAAVACAGRTHRDQAACTTAAAEPIALVDLPGNPFQAIPSANGCYVFVSLVGPVEPGDPRRPPQDDAPPGGVAVVTRIGGEPTLVTVIPLAGSPYGMVLTHDGELLIIASDDRVAFVDVARAINGTQDAVLGYLTDAPLAGRVYANVTRDDHWLFLSDESSRSISVVNLLKARESSFHASAVIGQIPVGRAPIALTFSIDQRFLYTTSQVAPIKYGWPADCRAPGSDTTRQPLPYAKGAVMIIDVARATRDPANSVLGAVPAGCNPVRLITSPRGDVAYVSARTDGAILSFDTNKLLADPANAMISRIIVGDAPVGLATLHDGNSLAVTNSNRFANTGTPPRLTIVDTHKLRIGGPAIVSTVSTGIFPRELRTTNDGGTLLLTNFGSKNLAVIDVARLLLPHSSTTVR
jgi:hypothetical protein